MQKMHDQFLSEKEEEHVVALARVRKDADKAAKDSDEQVRELKEKLLLAEEAAEKAAKTNAALPPPPPSEDIANLHLAHTAKLSEVEASSKSRIEELEMVRLSAVFSTWPELTWTAVCRSSPTSSTSSTSTGGPRTRNSSVR